MTFIWDQHNKQLLSPHCRQCRDPHFQRISEDFEPAGCCRYEPVFTLFELWKMVRSGEESFLKKEIWNHPQNHIYEYEIIAGAHMHSSFYEKREDGSIPSHVFEQLMGSQHTKYQAVDLRLKYGICPFFIKGEGCGLKPSFKTSICRMFICDSIEEALNKKELEKLHGIQRKVQEEANTFNSFHAGILREKGLDLIRHLDEVIDYLRQVE
ncbi:MAG TPA: hypothetical protein DDY49_05005 [Paenibacillaceae bacterium]|nr:hypothetical protein [Paenibacillaceae bacterium]